MGDIVPHMKWRNVGEIITCPVRLDKRAVALQPGMSENGDMVEKTSSEKQMILHLVAAQRRGFCIRHM